MKVRKAVITAAGWGTRFLPITRSQPKEMLPLVNKPLMQYVVEEAIASGITDIIIITAMGKHAIEDYFDRNFELEHFLQQKGETGLLEEMRQLSNLVDICYIRQKEQLGLGHAVLTARDIVGEEPFAVILPDDIVDSRVPCLKQMLEVYEEYGGSVIAVAPLPPQDIVKYGVIAGEPVSERVYRLSGLVEKPEPELAPSNLGIVGRYILTPQIFSALEATPPGRTQEIQLTDALQLLLAQEAIYAYVFDGVRHDTGTPAGWLKATVSFALRHPDFGQELRKYLKQLL